MSIEINIFDHDDDDHPSIGVEMYFCTFHTDDGKTEDVVVFVSSSVFSFLAFSTVLPQVSAKSGVGLYRFVIATSALSRVRTKNAHT